VRTITKILSILLLSANIVYAATPAESDFKSTILLWIFIGFVVIVLIFQAVPALIMFFSMLKGKFFKTRPENIHPLRKDERSK
jgi:hypothetical protein